MDRARGESIVFDEAYLAAQLPRSLEACRDHLRVFDRLKVVHVRDAPEAEVSDSPKRADIAPGAASSDAAAPPSGA
jgi:hypothetical protein